MDKKNRDDDRENFLQFQLIAKKYESCHLFTFKEFLSNWLTTEKWYVIKWNMKGEKIKSFSIKIFSSIKKHDV